MNKIILAVVAAFIAAAAYMITGAHPSGYRHYGDADAFGSDDDANARYTYELRMLCDPATGKIPDHIREKELAFGATLPNDAYVSASGKSTAVSWQQRGPWNVGGRTRAFAIDVNNENNFVAGSCSGGMWRSTDRGQTWHPTNLSNQCKSVSCLAQDTRPGHRNVWYYGSGEPYGTSASGEGAFYQGNGIYRSTDSGATWSILSATTTGHIASFDTWGDLIWNIAVNPVDPNPDAAIYAAGYGVLYKSTDGGTTWTLVLGVLGSSYFTDVAIASNGVVYASFSSDGIARGIYRSEDGTTFTNITPPDFPANYNRMRIGISPSDPNQVYFLGNTPNYGYADTNYLGTIEWNSLWRYTYLSGDGSGSGGRWQDRSANLPSTGGMFDKYSSQDSYDLVVKVKPNDTNVVFIGGTNLYRSTSAFTDNSHTTYIGGYLQGATLPVVNEYTNHHPDQHELAFFPGDPNKMVSTNDGGIFYCNDNSAPQVLWTSLNNGYITTMFYTCAIDHATNDNIVIGGAQDNGSWFTHTANLTDPWVTPRGGDGSYCAIADSGKAFYFSIQNGKVMRAQVDGSGTIDSFARIDPAQGHGYLFVNPFTLDPNNNNLMYLAGGRSLWRNNNLSGIPYASNWDSISTNWTRITDSLLVPTGYNISAITVCKKPADRLYFGTSNQKLYRIDSASFGTGLRYTHNITSVLPGLAFPAAGGNAAANIACVAVDPRDGDNIIVVFSNYNVYSLFHSTDGGATWQKIGGNLEENNRSGAGNGPSCRWASIIPVQNGTVYLVGTSIGLFATTQLQDTSTVWVQQGTTTIGSAVVDMIDYRATDGLVVVATHSNGIFSTHINQVADINGIKQLTLAQPDIQFTTFPNPFHDNTTIRFNLPDRKQVTLAVYDNMGRLVRTLADGVLDAGEKNYSFSSGTLPSGIYYCTLRADAFTETKRMVLTK